MPITRIEKIVAGSVVQIVEINTRSGKYVCHPFGDNTTKFEFDNLDDVATYLLTNPGSGVRMNPGWSKVCKNIYIDGTAR